MNLQTMEYLIAVAEEQSISRAAERLHITQQTLSAHLASVEEELGCRLFERRVPLKITYAGEEFLKYARLIQEQVQRMRHTFDAINGEEKGMLRIGITSNRGRIILFPVILDFQKVYPGIELKIVEDTNENLVQKLEKGDIDIGISDFSAGYTGSNIVPLYRERVGFFVEKQLFDDVYGEEAGEVLRRIREDREYKLLEVCPFLLGHEQDIAGKYARMFIKRSGIQPSVRMEAKNLALLMELCVEGLGGCFCPKMIADHVLTVEKKERLLEISLGKEAEYEICIGWRDGWGVIDSFVQMVRNHMDQAF